MHQEKTVGFGKALYNNKYLKFVLIYAYSSLFIFLVILNMTNIT